MAEAASAQDLYSGTKPVVDSHKFDEAKLAAWMEAHVEGYQGPLEVRQFKGGQSNPTYQLVTPRKKYVMRRKPPGTLLPSAHAVDREFTIISALYPLGYPVARPYGLCTDESVVGTMFYIMDMMEGRILWDGTLPDYEPAMRRKIYEAKIKTFADLHNVDWKKAGLEGFGKEGDEAVQGLRDDSHSGDGAADRMAAEKHPARRQDNHRAWRLPARQHGAAPDRAARHRGA
jgi:aminoglycoside phosphotransferase (APT) family kinase protein